jgi:hypothetical protein
MSFRVINHNTGQETDKLRGNVVLGRKSELHEYDDGRFTVDRVDVDDYVRLPGSLYDRRVSRNHILVAENPSWIDESLLNSSTTEVSSGETNMDVWDLNSASGTEVEKYDANTGHPLYSIAGDTIEVRPLNHYLGIAGPDSNSIGLENNVRGLESNLETRGFETDTITEASWDEIDQRLERLSHATEEESSTFIMYTGHGYSSGDMFLDDGKVDPDKFLDRVDDLSGDKVVVVDQCYAGKFENYDVPDDMTVYMATDAVNKTQGNSIIDGERRTRYAGRVLQAIESEQGQVDMDDIHRSVASVSKVANNNPKKKGPGSGLSRVK